jgi:hypothetical protein
VRKLITRLKSLVDWAGTAFTLIGWFGGTAWITGIGIAVGVAIWAVVRGVPVPIAIMAGYCTLAGGVVLAMAPVAYRAFSRIAAAPVPHDAETRQKPNADVWRRLPKFTLGEAACLLADVVPSGKIPDNEAYAWFQTLCAEIQSKQIVFIPSSLEIVAGGGIPPVESVEISREELQRFAERQNIRPRFLFPD